MVRGRKTIVPHRRRRALRTDYQGRLKILKSGKPRIVVRKSINGLMCQVVEYKTDGDKTILTADSKELKKFGWKAGTGNLPAAYLTGLLCGKKAKEKKITDAVLDTGLYTSTKGNRIYSALKGAVDGGLNISHSPDILPDDERIKGSHIASYGEWLKKENVDGYKKKFSKYIKTGISPESLPKHFEEVKGKILKN